MIRPCARLTSGILWPMTTYHPIRKLNETAGEVSEDFASAACTRGPSHNSCGLSLLTRCSFFACRSSDFELEPGLAAAPSVATDAAKGRKPEMRKDERRRRLSTERLPNPFVGPLQSSTASTSASSREYRDRPGPLNTAMQTATAADRAAGSSDHAACSGGAGADVSRAHDSITGRDGSYGSDGSSDSSTTGGPATIYSPEQVRTCCSQSAKTLLPLLPKPPCPFLIDFCPLNLTAGACGTTS